LSGYQSELSQRQDELQELAGGAGQSSVFGPLISAIDPASLTNILGVATSVMLRLPGNSLLILFVIFFALAEGHQFKECRIMATFPEQTRPESPMGIKLGELEGYL
jgi:predicted PurR-regulated permease PerM